jgi:DNA-binding protein Fis
MKIKKIEELFNWSEVLDSKLVDPFELRLEGPKSTLYRQLMGKFSLSLMYFVLKHPTVKGNFCKAARILGISRTTLRNKTKYNKKHIKEMIHNNKGA